MTPRPACRVCGTWLEEGERDHCGGCLGAYEIGGRDYERILAARARPDLVSERCPAWDQAQLARPKGDPMADVDPCPSCGHTPCEREHKDCRAIPMAEIETKESR